MKNANARPGASGKTPPQDIVERTFEFAVRVIQLCGKMDERPGVGRVMMSQILRAGTSVPSNVEEAQAAQSKPDFVSKMSIAIKEARETHLRLRSLAAANVFPETNCIYWFRKLTKSSASLVRSLFLRSAMERADFLILHF
jgi:four helix bundle protein